MRTAQRTEVGEKDDGNCKGEAEKDPGKAESSWLWQPAMLGVRDGFQFAPSLFNDVTG